MLEEYENEYVAEGSSLPCQPHGGAVLFMIGRHMRAANWAVEVASRLRGVQFPLDEVEARDKLSGLVVKGEDIGDVLDLVEFPVDTPAMLLHRIAEASGRSR